MVARRVRAEHLAVEHVRNPRERMPVGAVDLRESPGDCLNVYSTEHMRILGDILRVVEIRKPAIFERPINCNRSCYEENGNEQFSFGRR